MFVLHVTISVLASAPSRGVGDVAAVYVQYKHDYCELLSNKALRTPLSVYALGGVSGSLYKMRYSI